MSTLVLLPSLGLLAQTLYEWTLAANEPFDVLCVCSDDTVAKRGIDMVGLDDPAVFGHVAYALSFGEAIRRELLTDYRVVIIGVDTPTIAAWIDNSELLQTPPVSKPTPNRWPRRSACLTPARLTTTCCQRSSIGSAQGLADDPVQRLGRRPCREFSLTRRRRWMPALAGRCRLMRRGMGTAWCRKDTRLKTGVDLRAGSAYGEVIARRWRLEEKTVLRA